MERRFSEPVPRKDSLSLSQIDIFNHIIGFEADVQVYDELRISVRKSEADRFLASPQHAMPKPVAIK
jgi:hypothetical protein